MKKIREMTGSELLADRSRHEARKVYLEGLMARPGWGVEYSDGIESHEKQIREINSELVRRLMERENRDTTLPQRMIDAIQADSWLRSRTVMELMTERNRVVDMASRWSKVESPRGEGVVNTCESQLKTIDEEIERRVLQCEHDDRMNQGDCCDCDRYG